MKKPPNPVITPTAFSIARQFTGPPFSVMLESAELHRHLMEEIAHPGTEKLAKPAAGKKARKRRARVQKKPAKPSRKKKSKN